MLFPFSLLDVSNPIPLPALIGPDRVVTWNELGPLVHAIQRQLPTVIGKRVALPVTSTPLGIATFVALAESPCHLFLMAADTPASTRQRWSERFAWDLVIGRIADDQLDIQSPVRELPRELSDEASSRDSSRYVTILTSGTTGEPKGVTHTWQSLVRPVRRNVSVGARWLLTYRPHLYAGLQVVLQSLMNRGVLVLPKEQSTAQEVAALALSAGVEFASATPSYWRWLMTTADIQTLRHIPLQQITLGGEAVDQGVLNGLRQIFPETRLVHIYATTEMGRCFSVTDGKEGFPKSYLSKPSPDGIELRIEQHELQVRSANAMYGYESQAPASPSESRTGPTGISLDGSPVVTATPENAWFSTGDLVEIRGDRVYFVGRKTDMINVGGNKVYPLEVERFLRQVPGVADLRVYGQPSSLVGELVACDWVVAEGFDPQHVEQSIRQTGLQRLAPYQRPRVLQRVTEIPLTGAGKVRRTVE